MACLAGCGRSDGLTEISGTVSYDGQPVKKGTITFLPADGKGPTAATLIADGKYSVKVAPGKKLVKIEGYKVIGQHPFSPNNPRIVVDIRNKSCPPLQHEERADPRNHARAIARATLPWKSPRDRHGRSDTPPRPLLSPVLRHTSWRETTMSKTSPFFAVALLIARAAGQCWAGVTADRLRCEYRNDPLGIDVTKPRLSWIVKSDERGEKQTAYQVLAASTPEALADDQGDLWDSGRVDSDQTLHVEYAGKPLAARMRCYWKVRIWDKDGQPSPWSRPATWTMGLLKPSDWGDAKWIALGGPPAGGPITPHNGYHSEFAASADVTKWVAIDLGEDRTIDAVELDPARPYDYSPDTPGFLFPVRFKIEAAGKADFSDAKTVVDQTAADVANPGVKAPIYRFEPIAARYVRLTVTRLARREGTNFAFALAEMQVLSGKKNLAKGAAVTALDSIEAGGWSKDETGRRPLAARTAARPTLRIARRRWSARSSKCAGRSSGRSCR